MVINPGSLADKQAIVLGQTNVIFFSHQLGGNPQFVGGLFKMLQCLGVTRWHLFLGVYQNCQIKAVGLACLRLAPHLAAEVLKSHPHRLFTGDG